MIKIRRFSLLALFALFLFYLGHLLGLLGLVSHFEFGSGRPLLTDNYAFRSALYEEARHFFLSGKRPWGYSPFHMAGYPAWVLAAGSHGDMVLSILLPFMHPFELQKRVLLGMLLLIPLLLPLSARLFRLPAGAQAVVLIGGFLFFWKYPALSSFFWGSPAWVLASALAFLSAAFFHRFLEERKRRHFFGYAALGALAILWHPLVLVFFLPFGFLLALARPDRKGSFSSFFLGILFIFGLNLFWILPFFRFRGDLDLAKSWDYFLGVDAITFFSWFFRKDLSRLILLGLALAGLAGWRRKRPSLFWPFFVTSGLLFGCLCLFDWPSLLFLQRRRYDWALVLCLLLPASDFLLSSLKAFGQLIRERGHAPLRPSRGFFKGLFVTFALLLAVGTSDRSLYLSALGKLGISNKTFETARPFPTSFLPVEAEAFIRWLREETTDEVRVLLEDSNHPLHVYWGTHLPAILPLLTGREVIANITPEGEIVHRFATFSDGVLFGRPIASFTPEELNASLALYNVKWAILHTPAAREAFRRLPKRAVQTRRTIDHFEILELNRKGNFFLKGSGRRRADYNRIVLKNVVPEDGEVVLSYHWTRDIRTVPERRVERVMLGEDPVGFIKILDPPEELEIRF